MAQEFSQASMNTAPNLADKEQFLQFFRLRDKLAQQVETLHVYSHLRADEDATNSHYQAMNDRALAVYTQFGEQQSWANPELLAMDEAPQGTYLCPPTGDWRRPLLPCRHRWRQQPLLLIRPTCHTVDSLIDFARPKPARVSAPGVFTFCTHIRTRTKPRTHAHCV